eukprot:6197587-Pleurochrysis_carterae.AAC.4
MAKDRGNKSDPFVSFALDDRALKTCEHREKKRESVRHAEACAEKRLRCSTYRAYLDAYPASVMCAREYTRIRLRACARSRAACARRCASHGERARNLCIEQSRLHLALA